MKHLFLTAAVAVFSLIQVNAQTEKGNFTFSGSSTISFSSSKLQGEFEGEEVGDETTVNLFTLTPSVGYFVIDNLSLNVEVGYSSQKQENDISEFKTNTLGLFLGGNYFFETGSEKFKPFVGLSGGLSSAKTTINFDNGFDPQESTDESSGFTYVVRGGLSYFINQNVSVDFLLRYLSANLEDGDDSDFVVKDRSFGVGLGFSIFL